MGGTIADRIDVRQAGPAMRVDVDSIAALGACVDQRLHFGNDADADDRHFGGDRLTGMKASAAAPASFPEDAIDLNAGAQFDAMGAMLRLVKLRDWRASDARQDSVERL